LELAFSHAHSDEQSDLKSVAPKGTVMESFKSRIVSAANSFHVLMQRRRAYMESELAAIASWVNLPDK
jgi:hypothetical protein